MNPPGPEYKALEQCYPTLKNCLQQAPSDVVVQLRPSGILATRDIKFLSNPNKDDDEKAERIVDIVMMQVRGDPQVYHTFTAALNAAGDWTRAAATKLEQRLDFLMAYTSTGLSFAGSDMQHLQGNDEIQRPISNIDTEQNALTTCDKKLMKIKEALLAEPTLDELCALPVENVWYQLGLWLGVDERELKNIKQSDYHTLHLLDQPDSKSDYVDCIYRGVSNEKVSHLRAKAMFSCFLETEAYEKFIQFSGSIDETALQKKPEEKTKKRDLELSKCEKLVNGLSKVGLRREAERICVVKGK